MFKLYIATIVVLLTTIGCSIKPNVFVDSDPLQDFSFYKTFTWTNIDPMIVQSDYVVSPFVGEQVKDEIKLNLTNKGYKFFDEVADADIAISFTIGARDKVQVRTEPAIIYSDWRWGGQYWGTQIIQTERATTYTKGTLAIDVFDVKRRSPVWHGVGSKRLNSADKRGESDDIGTAVTTILVNFPILE